MERGIRTALRATVFCLGLLLLLIAGAECFLKEDEAFSISIGGHVVGVGPWFRTGHGFSHTTRANVDYADGTCAMITVERRGWLVWSRSSDTTDR